MEHETPHSLSQAEGFRTFLYQFFGKITQNNHLDYEHRDALEVPRASLFIDTDNSRARSFPRHEPLGSSL